MKNPFSQHPQHIGQSYFAHLRFAFKNGLSLLFFGVLLLTHAVFPFVFENNSRDAVIKMADKFNQRIRARQNTL